MVFHWSLSDSKSPQVSRTLLNIMADLNNAVVWTVSTRPVILKSLYQSFGDYTKSTNYNWYNCHFRVPQFFHSLTRSRYLSFFSYSFSFIQWSAITAKTTILQVLSFLLIIIRSGLMAEIRWSVCVSKSRGVCMSHSPEQILGCAYIIRSYDQTTVSYTSPSGSPSPPSRA